MNRSLVNFRALGRKAPRTMNKTEQQHAWSLAAQVHDNPRLISGYEFEAIKLFIGMTPEGRQMWYCPDFMVQRIDKTIEFHEVKGGYIPEDGYVKLTAAARMYPMFIFVLYQKTKAGWRRKEIAAR
jgi:hypothetical protein